MPQTKEEKQRRCAIIEILEVKKLTVPYNYGSVSVTSSRAVYNKTPAMSSYDNYAYNRMYAMPPYPSSLSGQSVHHAGMTNTSKPSSVTSYGVNGLCLAAAAGVELMHPSMVYPGTASKS